MSEQVKRYFADCNKLWSGDKPRDECDVRVVLSRDYDALHAEAKALWSTYIALVDKLGIDTEIAKTADGKPSDVIVSYVEELRSQRDRMAQILRDLVPGCKWRIMRPRIDKALLEVDGGN